MSDLGFSHRLRARFPSAPMCFAPLSQIAVLSVSFVNNQYPRRRKAFFPSCFRHWPPGAAMVRQGAESNVRNSVSKSYNLYVTRVFEPHYIHIAIENFLLRIRLCSFPPSTNSSRRGSGEFVYASAFTSASISSFRMELPLFFY